VYEQVSSVAAEGARALPGGVRRARVLEMSDVFALVQDRLVELMRDERGSLRDRR
jgi:hypothetical protein